MEAAASALSSATSADLYQDTDGMFDFEFCAKDAKDEPSSSRPNEPSIPFRQATHHLSPAASLRRISHAAVDAVIATERMCKPTFHGLGSRDRGRTTPAATDHAKHVNDAAGERDEPTLSGGDDQPIHVKRSSKLEAVMNNPFSPLSVGHKQSSKKGNMLSDVCGLDPDFELAADHPFVTEGNAHAIATLSTEMQRTDSGCDVVITNKFPFFLLLPHSTVLHYWKRLYLVMLGFVAIITPVELAFGRVYAPLAATVTVYVFFVLDLLKNFVTAYRSKSGRFVFERKTIARHYTCSPDFWIDLVSIVPSFLFEDRARQGAEALRLLRLLKLRVYFVRDKRLNLHMFATLIVFLVHWFVCAWPSSDRGGRS